jgi:NAD(P)-dependent dehydrogenase (short-subunit alcohol dehydrogenase family)
MSLAPDRGVVFISGASGALGSAVSDVFLARGATVVGVASRWSAERAAAQGEHFFTIDADLETTAGAEAAVRTTLTRAHRIDAVVHVAGGYVGGKTIAETDDATWDHMLNLNLRTAFNVFRAALPHLLQQKSGRLVAIGSRAGEQPVATLGAYGVSKAALSMLVRTIAAEVVNTGVTANIVLPSVIDTTANRVAMPKADFSRWVQPRAIAELIAYLCSDLGRDVNGAAIPVYGGA